MRLIHLTDLHLRAPGQALFGLDPLARLDAALASIQRHEPTATHLLITGDLTDEGGAEAYAALAERLARVTADVVLLVGNHDDRAAFRARFGDHHGTVDGFVQRVVDDMDGISLVTLDTLVPGAAGGALCAVRLDWLDAVLRQRAARAVYIAMHHPPVAMGMAGLDAIGLDDADGFWRVVQAHPQVRHIFAGHIHRPFFARRGTVSISTLPSPVQQVHLQFRDPDVALGSLEAGAYGIAELGTDSLALHVRAFTDANRRFVFNETSRTATSPETLPPVPTIYDRLL